MSETKRLGLFYAQGARCGHVDGKSAEPPGMRLFPLSFEAADAQAGMTTVERGAFADGYRHGYMLACSNIPLEDSLANAPLPNEN